MKKMILAVSAAVAAFAVSGAVEKPSIEPRWSGASVAEWTMDYTTALKSAKSGGNWSIMYYTGSWWCPFCKALETKVLEADAWKAYAAGRGFYEIEMDYPARNGTGRNCWLWDEDYLAKNGLNATKATAALKTLYAQQDKYALPDARKQVCTNGTAKVTYKRINYPSFLVLRPDGSVAGRFVPGVLDGYEFDGETPSDRTWTPEEAFVAVTNAIEEIVANADTHVTTSVAEECAGMGTVTALDKTVNTGTSVALKATAAKGFYFAGWYQNGAPAETASDYRTAANSYVTQGGVAALEARFATAAEDYLAFDVAADLSFFDVNEEIEPLPLVVESETLPSVKVTGLPTGLKFDAKTLTLSGKPTKEGVYYVTVYAKNASGYEYTQVAVCTVGEPEEPPVNPFDVYVDLEGLEDLAVGMSVGDESELETAVYLGDYDGEAKEGITKVAGLPAGLKLVTVEEKSTKSKSYFVVGAPTKPGVFEVTVSCTYLNDKNKAVNGSVKATLAVATEPSVYLAVESAQPEAGTAAGGGVYAWGATAKLSAKAAKNHVFVGWFAEAACEVPLTGEAYDFRNPALQVAVDEFLASSDWYAGFTHVTNDTEVAVVSDDFAPGGTVDFDAAGLDAPFVLAYEVDSLSLPTVKVTGLPAGFEASTTAPGQAFAISYDPAKAKKTPAPGVYAVKITATNVSKASATAEFAIKVANWKSTMIPVEEYYPDDYGFTPGEAIEAIDFSEIAENGTLTVSGLPKGLTFNTKDDARKGIKANTVTGAPTTPGSYTATFTLKAPDKTTYQATSTFVVAPFPELTVDVDDEAAAAGCKVTGAGGYMAGSKVTLKATAAKGWVFAGWEGFGGSLMQVLNPTLQIVTGDEDAAYKANFLRVCDDWLWISDYDTGIDDDEEWETLALDLNADIGENAEAILDLVDSGSLPTVTVSGLPTGLKFDAKTLLLTGKPTKAGVYYANVSAKNVGGYAHSIVLRVMVRNADGSDVEEPAEENTADVDLTALDDLLMTGELIEDLEIEIPGYSEDDSVATAVAVSGLPKGLTATFDKEAQVVVVAGIPTAAGRVTVKFAVTYANKKKANSVHSVIVRNGGSAYLFVSSSDLSMGTVTGEGVYAAGATVKLTAKAGRNNVFAGWTYPPYVDDDSGEEVVTPLEIEGYDFRNPNVSFAMTVDLAGESIVGWFAPSASDLCVSFEADETVWEIDPDESSVFEFSVVSASLPTVKATGLPKGVSLAKDGMSLVYSKADKAKLVPGKYAVELTAQNVSKAKASASVTVVVSVPESEFFQGYGLNQSDEGYTAMAGVYANSLSELSDVYQALGEDGLTVTFKNLPAGLKAASGVIDETPFYIVGGVPTKPGSYTVTVTAKGTIDGEAVNETAQFFITVDPLPAALVGTFNGVVYMSDPYDLESEYPREVAIGSVALTAKADGQVSATVVRPTGTFKVSGEWVMVDVEGGLADFNLYDAKETSGLYGCLDMNAGTAEWQMTGGFWEGTDSVVDNLFCAQRNAFAAGDAEALAAAAALKGAYTFDAIGSEDTPSGGKLYSYAYNPKTPAKTAALSATVDAKGGVKFAGKYGTKSFSGSSVLALGTDDLGAPTMTAELVWKNDGESVGIAMVTFVYDEETGAWSLVEPDGIGATVEVYESDCGACSD